VTFAHYIRVLTDLLMLGVGACGLALLIYGALWWLAGMRKDERWDDDDAA
jgi:hypothetical protein